MKKTILTALLFSFCTFIDAGDSKSDSTFSCPSLTDKKFLSAYVYQDTVKLWLIKCEYKRTKWPYINTLRYRMPGKFGHCQQQYWGNPCYSSSNNPNDCVVFCN